MFIFVLSNKINIMKKYLVSFRNKKTGAVVKDVVVEANEKLVKDNKKSLVLLAISKLKENGETIPRNVRVSYRLFE